MSWICPTFGRPDRLSELAGSWVRQEGSKRLWVRLWRGDPFLESYRDRHWPDSWQFYESDEKTCPGALNEFYHSLPDEEYYGFIGDDVVLRTKHGLGLLEKLAGDWFFVYPNDGMYRDRGAAHFCLGGELVRTMGCFSPGKFTHNYLDVALKNIAANCGLVRYAPDVMIEHRHFLNEKAPRDATYNAVWGDIPTEQIGNTVVGKDEWDEWVKAKNEKGFEPLVKKVRRALLDEERERYGAI